MKDTITPIVGKNFENPSDAFNKEEPISSPTIASAKYRYDTVIPLNNDSLFSFIYDIVIEKFQTEQYPAP